LNLHKDLTLERSRNVIKATS